MKDYNSRRGFTHKMQQVAIARIYPTLWSDFTVTEVDMLEDPVSRAIDIAGGDKMLRHPGLGYVVYLAQRFRQADVWQQYPHFTIREAEWQRHIAALRNGGMVPGYYIYGYSDEQETDFLRVYIVRYPEWLAYVLSEQVEDVHRPRFKNRGGGKDTENFFWVAWNNMPARFSRLVYARGLVVNSLDVFIQQPATGQPIQLRLWVTGADVR